VVHRSQAPSIIQWQDFNKTFKVTQTMEVARINRSMIWLQLFLILIKLRD